MRPTVIITDYVTDDLAPERQILGDRAELLALGALSEAELSGRIDDAAALLVYHNIALTQPTLERLTRCRVIVRCGVGVDNVDWRFARTRGIPVANVPDYGTEEIADTALALTLALTRGTHRYNRRLQADPAAPWKHTIAAPLARLRGRTFGVLGVGRIGTATALRAKACGFDVAFYDPFVTDGTDKALGLRRVQSFDELLAQSAVLSAHCPLTDATHHIIDAVALAKLPHGAYLVNTARGAVVDTVAVLAAIESGQLAGAALDVLPHEPPSPDDPLLRAWRDPQHPAHERVILTPHAAFYSEEGLHDIRVKSATAVRDVLDGKAPRNVINL